MNSICIVYAIKIHIDLKIWHENTGKMEEYKRRDILVEEIYSSSTRKSKWTDNIKMSKSRNGSLFISFRNMEINGLSG